MTTSSKEVKNKKSKKTTKRLVGDKKKIYNSLKEQLKLTDNYNPYTEDLLRDYLTMYDTKCMLTQNIENVGVSIKYDNGGGQKGWKSNPSVDLLNRTNAQMLKLLAALGLKPSKMKKALLEDDDDDEL